MDHPIFLESIKFIRSHLIANDLNYLEKKVLERLVHTSGDFSVQNLIEFSEGACEKGLQALKNGAPILTDTDMAASAIKSMAENTTRNKVFTAVNTLFLVVFSAMDFIADAAISVSVKIGAPFLSAWSPFSHAPSLNSIRFWTEKSPEVWTNLSRTFFSK